MTQSLEISGKKYIPSTEIAKGFTYSPDYISRLAREGKISATRVGRQWFIDRSSLERFVTDSNNNKENRSEALRKQRSIELMAFKDKKKKRARKKNHEVHMAVAQTSLVMSLGLMVGLMSVLIAGNNMVLSDFQTGIGKMYAQLIESFLPERELSTETAGTSASAFIKEAVPLVSRGVRNDPRNFLDFSDEIKVLSETDTTMIIQPIFKDDQEGALYKIVR